MGSMNWGQLAKTQLAQLVQTQELFRCKQHWERVQVSLCLGLWK